MSSSVKHHQPYFTADEIDQFSEKQRGKLTSRDETKLAEAMCAWIEAVGSRIGLYATTLKLAGAIVFMSRLFPAPDAQ